MEPPFSSLDLEQQVVIEDTIFQTHKLMEEFRKQREKSKQTQFVGVLFLGWKFIGVGVLGFSIDYVLFQYASFYPDMVSLGVTAFLLLFCNVGIIIFSTVPLEYLDMDTIMDSSLIYWPRFLVAICTILVSCVVLILPPHTGSIILAISSSLILNSKYSFGISFTRKLGMWYISFILVLATMALYFAVQAKQSVEMNTNEALITVATMPNGPLFYTHYSILSGYYSISFAVLCGTYFYNRRLHCTSNGEKGAGPTKSVYIAIYGWSVTFGIGLIIQGVWLMLLSKHETKWNCFRVGLSCITVGCANLFPSGIVCLLTSEYVFNYMARRFDLDPKNLEKDGAFIAGLLDTCDIYLRQSWFIHKKFHGKDCDWIEGVVIQIEEKRFAVRLNQQKVAQNNRQIQPSHGMDNDGLGDDQVIWMNSGLMLNSTELLVTSRENLRCIDWKNLSKELLINGSVREIKDAKESLNYYSLSRCIYPGESIDYFISHSWQDDGDMKYEKLEELAREHVLEFGKEPTFWFDKVCIDQSNIGLGLKVLPINIMACKKMLVLCGSTYINRLWCIWELCTLFAFSNQDYALERIVMLPLNNHDSTLDQLKNFDIKYAHCYDPNEESRLRKVINAVGVARFHAQVHSLANKCLNSHVHSRKLSTKKMLEYLHSTVVSADKAMILSDVDL